MNSRCLHRKSFLFLWLTFSLLRAQSQTSYYSLESALKAARSNNPTLKTGQFYLGIAESDIVTARLRPNPILNNQSLVLSNSKYFADNTTWGDAKNRQTWWQLTKPFQWPGQRQGKIDFAKKQHELTSTDYQEVQRNVLLEVANKWLDAWATQMNLNLIRIAKANLDSLASMNKLRLKNQVITQTDLMRTQLLVNQYDLQLKEAEQDFRNQLKELGFLVGVKDSLMIGPSDEFFSRASQMESIDSLFANALRSRSDAQTATAALSLSDANIKLQKAMAFPQPELGVILNPQNTVPYLGFFGTIDLPFFARNQGEIQKSRVMKLQAQQNVESIKAKIETEVQVAYNSFRLRQQNLGRYNDLLAQASIILDNVRYAYLRGGTTIIDFLEAQRSWLETRQRYNETLQQYRQSYIQLLFASGIINQFAQ